MIYNRVPDRRIHRPRQHALHDGHRKPRPGGRLLRTGRSVLHLSYVDTGPKESRDRKRRFLQLSRPPFVPRYAMQHPFTSLTPTICAISCNTPKPQRSISSPHSFLHFLFPATQVEDKSGTWCGVMLLLLFLFFDSFTSQWQSRMFSKHEVRKVRRVYA